MGNRPSVRALSLWPPGLDGRRARPPETDARQPDAPTAEPAATPATAGAGQAAVEERAPDVAADGPGGQTVDVLITFFACEGDGYCGTMANGQPVHEGAAACGQAFPLGTRFRLVGDPTGRDYLCEDRGFGPYYWIDVWFPTATEGYAWQAIVGSYGTVRLLP